MWTSTPISWFTNFKTWNVCKIVDFQSRSNIIRIGIGTTESRIVIGNQEPDMTSSR